MSPRSTRARLLAVLAAVVTGLGVTSVVTSGPAAAVPVNQTWAVPTDASIAIDGHGFGHGTGMSQYGALGAARQGLTHNQILRFYYPGVWAGTATGTIGVRITADNDGDVVVQRRGGLVLIDTATNKRTPIPLDLGTGGWRLSYGGADTTIVSYYANKKWNYWTRTTGEAVFYANGGEMTLQLKNGTVKYRGILRGTIPTPGSSRRDTVNLVTLEHYLRGVVPREMPSSWTPAAVQAQAVAARTYAAQARTTPQSRSYDLCDTTSCQVYGGFSAEERGSNAAIDATKGQILTNRGQEIAFTQFSSSNGGWTNTGNKPYLVAKQDPYDGNSANANHTWIARITDRTIEAAWPQIGNLTSIAVTDRNGKGEWGGRVNSVTFRGSKGSVTVTGATLRSKLGLKSTWINFRVAAR